MIGTQVGKYQITERVGGGGFATVYRGQDVETGQTVAIKILRSEYSEDALSVERFRREAEMVRSLPDHPGIVKTLDYGQAGNARFLVMEFVSGDDLDRVLLRQGKMTVDQAVDIASQVADALAVAHRRGIVHRDVKPQNIKLLPDGTAKVLDFGIARPTEGTGLTQTGAFVGTPQYMAPEIWEGQKATARADIYSLGIVLYELIAGRPPFQSSNPASVMRQHLMEQPRALSTVRVDTPKHVVWIVSRCLAKAPEQRYATAAELLAALRGQAEVAPLRPAEVQPPPRMIHSIPLSVQIKRTWIDLSKRANSAISRLPEAMRGQPRAYVIGRAGRVAGARFRLSAKDTILGQATNCRIQLEDRYLSPHHARIYFTNNHYYLFDLNSRHGTYLNGQRLRQPRPLRHGDQIQIGESVFNFAIQEKRPSRRLYRGPRQEVADQLLAAAAAHASVLLVIPLVVPAFIWAVFRDRSPYVSHQAKQALLYQGVYLLLIFLRIAIFSRLPFWLLWLPITAWALYAAYRCYTGQHFMYPVLGDLASRF